MKRKTFAIVVALITFVVGVGLARLTLQKKPPIPKKKELQISNYRLSGPYQHENLTVFLVHGPDQPDSRMFTTLQDAMERKIVVVHETSDVNELTIENTSNVEEVFVQAGDIVKGGRQDRVLSVDLILPAKSGKVPISSFCVENGRWSQRGDEPAGLFTISAEMVATRKLKIATRTPAAQTQVWNEVRDAQEKLSKNVGTSVADDASETSLQLSLEHGKVQETAAAYVDKLSSIVNGSNDVIGFAFAINNELNSADVYSSSALFKRFWPRLLKAAAIESVAELAATGKNEEDSMTVTGEFLVSSERGDETFNDVTKRTRMIKRDGAK
ncbi:MAG TPA: DUF6569 family protein, partial [Pyrinomonadaceae bacterium]|nr:DUF6569 family protein [Pyrinomonadaceae bacterium]